MRTPRVLATALLACSLMVCGVSPMSAAQAEDTGSGSFSASKKVARYVGTADADGQTGDSYDVTVTADVTTQLQGRERVRIAWSGARPSGARSASPFAENGITQEFPVVILQCRGRGDKVVPETCWTNSRIQRSQDAPASDAIWTRDLFVDDAGRGVKTGLTPYPAAACADNDPARYVHVTPFIDAAGKVWPSCTADTMAPEAAVGASFPAADQAGFTDRQGNGSAMFEVRSDVENKSLGCNYRVDCSIVVIPIVGMSCLARGDAGGSGAAIPGCRQGASFEPGSTNFANQGTTRAVTGQFWWAPSNWRNRIQIPISFGLPPSACDVLDPRAPTPFFGSELLHQAAIQWAPAFCLTKGRFKWQANGMPDQAAFSLMEQGEAVAANVSGQRASTGSAPVAYAPTAVTGFAISYVIDRPDNAGEFGELRLNARLLAKLLTQSYPASYRGRGHPGLEKNPLTLTTDPEFTRLNPGLTRVPAEAASTLASLSTSSDVISALTGYIGSDPAARQFISGKPDPYGMKVNPSFRGISLPVAQWPSLDTWVAPSQQECEKANPTPYLPAVAAPVQSMETIANAVLDGWPLVAIKCDRATSTDPWKLGRIDRQGMGSRFVIGVTSLGDAERLGLRKAALETRPGSFVGPTQQALSGAIATARRGRPLQAWRLDPAALRAKGAAYPGTMVVYSAARTRGMAGADAAKVAQFIEVATSEGQVPGRGNGQLPAGFLPLRKSGVTAGLWAQAQAAAAAIRAQRGPRTASPGTATPPGRPGSAANAVTGTTGGGLGAASAPGGGAAAAAAPAAGKAPPATVAASASVPTTPLSSRLGGLLLPILLVIGLIAGVVAAAGRFSLRRQGSR